MAIIKNNRENPFQFNALVDGLLTTFTIEGGVKNGDDFTPGQGEVPDEVLQSLAKNPVVKSWFEDGALELIDAPKPASKAKADKEPA